MRLRVETSGSRTLEFARDLLAVVNLLLKYVDAGLARLLRGRVTPVQKPLIILGPERSGTTLLYSVLSNDPGFYWFSRLDSAFPDAPVLVSSVRRLWMRVERNRSHLAVPGMISRSSGAIPPAECVPYWARLFGFGPEAEYGIEDDVSTDEDLDEATRTRVLSDFGLRLAVAGKPRLLLKWPGFALKLKYLNRLFPDALFLQVSRHPLYNMLSLVEAKKRSGLQYWGTKVPGWREQRELGYELQAARQLEAIYRLTEQDRASLALPADRYMTIRYEDLFQQPEETLKRICAFSGLAFSKRFQETIRGITPRHREISKLRENLSEEALAVVDSLAARLGYVDNR